jgi:CRP-like cAMP-binding protein
MCEKSAYEKSNRSHFIKFGMTSTQYENRILAGLTRSELALLQRHLSPLDMPIRMVLQAAGEPSEYAYFPETGIASMVSALRDGTTVEVGLIGREGVVGLPGVMGGESLPFECFIQVPGKGYRMKSKRLKELFEDSKTLRKRLLCAAQAQLVQMGQIAVCNRIHNIEERLARWLLSCHDRISSDDLILTHEFMATMLGTPRSTVSLAASTLQRAGFIEYSRGHIYIKDRKALERTACECYGIIRKETERLGFA